MDFFSSFSDLTTEFGSVAGTGIAAGALLEIAHADRDRNATPLKPLLKMTLGGMLL